jgi:DNA polymerase III delta subunit
MSIFFICGDQDYLRDRCLRNLILEKVSKGFRIEHSDGTNLIDNISNPFVEEPSFVVVENSKEIDKDLVSEFNDLDDQDVCFVWKGKPRANSSYIKMSKSYEESTYRFDKVSPWKETEQAEQFMIHEAKIHGKILSPTLATILVRLLGTDLGVLSFEVLKMAALCDIDGGKEILGNHAKAAMARVTEASLVPFSKALGKRSESDILIQADRIKKTHAGDPTMRMCGFLTPQVLKWVVAASLRDRGMVSAEVAEIMGENAWFFKNHVLPSVSEWGFTRSRKLLAAISESERSVKRGVIDPWIAFLCRITELC